MRFMSNIMYFLLLVLVMSFSSSTLRSQNYFQQKVDYKIHAHLDTLNQTLDVQCVLSYKNNSNQNISEIPFHLWWNAYGSKTSAFAEQVLMTGNNKFHFADESQLGGYKQIQFFQENAELKYENYQDDLRSYEDIVNLKLSQPIKPGQSSEIVINYLLKIPFAFSRAGFKDKLYRMTQWYPKPAVLDQKGWHPMPYLAYGEYYSEFGDYEVSLDLPISFSTGHTGLPNESRTEYDTENRRKVIYINAENVHDFAWFSSEYYLPYTDYIDIDDETKRVIVFVKEDNEDWEKLTNYAKRALSYYSYMIGPYPYPQVTIVEESDAVGGGMEYPMVTIISNSGDDQKVDHLVAHEIGHNWFHAILANNEREFAWMDEGMNSYFEHKYDQKHYDFPVYNENIPPLFRPRALSSMQAGIISLEKSRRTMSISKSSKDFDPLSYVSMNYEKMAWAFEYLKNYLGEDVFLEAVRSYYKDYQFKHVYPQDMQSIFEEVSNKNLDWFFESFIGSDGYLDYSISKANYDEGQIEFIVKNRGQLEIPFSVDAINNDGELVSKTWFDPIEIGQSKRLSIQGDNIKDLVVNGSSPFIDIKPNNNYASTGLNLLKRPLDVQVLKNNNDVSKNKVALWPSILTNSYDGIMLGFNMHNSIFPYQNTRWYINPTYAIGSNSLSGAFAIEHDFINTNGRLRKWTLGLDGRKFSHREIPDFKLDYYKLAPSVTFHLAKDLFNNSSLQYKLHYINEEKFSFTDPSIVRFRDPTIIHQLNFRKEVKRRLSVINVLTQIEYEKYDQFFEEEGEYLKLSLTYDRSTYYNEDSKFFIRFFGAYFPINSERESSAFASDQVKGSIALTSQGFTDHTFEELYFSRNGDASNGGSSSQITEVEGGFKNTFLGRFPTGYSNDWGMALNLKMDLPFKILGAIRARPYVDLAYLNTKQLTADPLEGEFYLSGGLSFEVGNVMGIYLPLVNSKNINQNYNGEGLFSRISFKYDLRKLNPWAIADNPQWLLY